MKTTVAFLSTIVAAFMVVIACSTANVNPTGQAKTAALTDTLTGFWKLTKIVAYGPAQNAPVVNTNVDDQIYQFGANQQFTLYKNGQKVEEGIYATKIERSYTNTASNIIHFFSDATYAQYSVSADLNELTLSVRLSVESPMLADGPSYVFTRQK